MSRPASGVTCDQEDSALPHRRPQHAVPSHGFLNRARRDNGWGSAHRLWNAVDRTPGLEHAAIVHGPFHIMKLAGAALDELRREVFFRAGEQMRALGAGRRWLLLNAWERTTTEERANLDQLLALNRTLARAYQIKEELREVLAAPDGASMEKGLGHILRRTPSYAVRLLRRLHDTLHEWWHEIIARAVHRPATGRVEALNNN